MLVEQRCVDGSLRLNSYSHQILLTHLLCLLHTVSFLFYSLQRIMILKDKEFLLFSLM